jgi:hypothetical protein
MKKLAAIFLSLTLLNSCADNHKVKAQNSALPSWYVKPKQNDAQNLYGAAQGNSVEEATKYALVDAASRLMLTISSQSELLREENKTDSNEEMRQKVSQNIEKIDFINFKVSQSEQLGALFYAEVQIQRDPFIADQKDKLNFLENQISDLEKIVVSQASQANIIQKRVALLKILDLSTRLELSGRILSGAGENVDVKTKLGKIANYKNQLNLLSNKLEFYFEINSPKEVAQIIRSSLNKEKIKIASSRNSANPYQVMMKIKSSNNSNKIYGAYITKTQIDFENYAADKVVASSTIEVTGSSTISEKESYAAAITALQDKINDEGILKILGIIN